QGLDLFARRADLARARQQVRRQDRVPVAAPAIAEARDIDRFDRRGNPSQEVLPILPGRQSGAAAVAKGRAENRVIGAEKGWPWRIAPQAPLRFGEARCGEVEPGERGEERKVAEAREHRRDQEARGVRLEERLLLVRAQLLRERFPAPGALDGS